MIVELFDKLIDRCIQLRKVRENNNGKFLANHVDPVMDSFQVVHQTYIDTFQSLRGAIKNGQPDTCHVQLREQLESDSLWSLGERVRLHRSVATLTDKRAVPLATAISEYMHLWAIPDEHYRWNGVRYSVIERTLRTSLYFPQPDDVAHREHQLGVVDSVVADLQENTAVFVLNMIRYGRCSRLHNKRRGGGVAGSEGFAEGPESLT